MITQVWGHTCVIPARGRWRPESSNLRLYSEVSCLKKGCVCGSYATLEMTLDVCFEAGEDRGQALFRDSWRCRRVEMNRQALGLVTRIL